MKLQDEFRKIQTELAEVKALRQKDLELIELKNDLKVKTRILRLMGERLTDLEEAILRANRGKGTLDTALKSEKRLLSHLDGPNINDFGDLG